MFKIEPMKNKSSEMTKTHPINIKDENSQKAIFEKNFFSYISSKIQTKNAGNV